MFGFVYVLQNETCQRCARIVPSLGDSEACGAEYSSIRDRDLVVLGGHKYGAYGRTTRPYLTPAFDHKASDENAEKHPTSCSEWV